MCRGEENKMHHHNEGEGRREETDCGCGSHGSEMHHEEHQRGEDCGCGGHHNRHHHEGQDCGCGGQSHHGQGGMGWDRPHPGCDCPGHRMGIGGSRHMGMMPGMGMRMGMGFGRRFISRDEIIARLEEYQKQLQAEAKGVEERIAELKRKGESHQG